MEKSTPLWCEECRFVSFETGLGKPMLTLNDPNGFKNSTNVYSIHPELRMALPCQISTGKWKYVNPCLDFLGIPDQRTVYVKRQVRPRWTYVRRSSVTPDLVIVRFRYRTPYIFPGEIDVNEMYPHWRFVAVIIHGSLFENVFGILDKQFEISTKICIYKVLGCFCNLRGRVSGVVTNRAIWIPFMHFASLHRWTSGTCFRQKQAAVIYNAEL